MTTGRALLCAVAALVASTAQAGPADKPGKIAHPEWKRTPTNEMLTSAMPRRAFERGVDGRASIGCVATDLGLLKDCVVIEESPSDYGFGAAALALAPFFELKPLMTDGKPVGGGSVVVPVIWRLSEMRGGAAVSGRSLLASPPWAVAPSWAQVRAVWPVKAGAVPDGFVTLRCRLTGEGAPIGCATLTEAPDRLGFEDAARSLLKTFRLSFSEAERPQLKTLVVDIPFHFRNSTQGDARKLNPRWVRTLSPEAMASLYPSAAAAAGVWSGVGWVRCGVTATGELADCALTREEPPGLGFGAAALEAARIMRMNPWTEDGEPAEGRVVTVPLRFEAQASAAPDKPD